MSELHCNETRIKHSNETYLNTHSQTLHLDDCKPKETLKKPIHGTQP